MKVYKPPFNIKTVDLSKSVFLAGTIDMGASFDWQTDLSDSLHDLDGVVLNPRRDEWDNSWVQSIERFHFRNQVQWEMYGLEKCSLIALYLLPGSASPISLLELGLYAASNKIIVCCPKDFYRSGNIEIVCNHYNIPIFTDYEQFKQEIKTKVGRLF